MARLTIEEKWWTDPRRSYLGKLVGGEELADGYAIKLWRLAQEFWGRGRSPIPTELFNTIEAAPKLIQAGLAIVQADGVYVKGSSDYIDWLNEKREAARKGGQKSAQRPRDARGRLTKNPKQPPSTHPSKSSSVQPSGSGSGSDFGFGLVANPSDSAKKSPQTQEFIAAYCRHFKAKYGTNPPFSGKQAGIAKRLCKELSPGTLELYLEAYFAMPDSWLHKIKHPIEAFESKLNEVAVFAKTGKFTTQRQVRQADDAVTNLNLLEQIKAGNL